MRCLLFAVALCGSLALLVATAPVARAAGPTATCTSSVGPGIPPPASVPSGIPGFHAHWFGQSGYPTLCPGEKSTATVAYYNSGSLGWVSNRMGEMAFLGTSDPIPGRDKASQLGGDGSSSPDTDWPRNNRVAAQPAAYVGPGQVSWFQFTIQAPTAPGTYLLYIRPLIEGAVWMEDFGVYWQVTVKPAESAEQITVTPTSAASTEIATTRGYTATPSVSSGCVDLAFIDAGAYPANINGELPGYTTGKAELSNAARYSQLGSSAGTESYVDCFTPPGQTFQFSVYSNTPAYVRPIVFRDLNVNNALDIASEPWGLGGAVRFLPPESGLGTRSVMVSVVSTGDNYFIDAAGTATYWYDGNDGFQYGGIPLSIAQFEQVISARDVLAVTYQPDPAQGSSFNITNDVGREEPIVEATVDSFDQGPTQNDVLVRITEPATNVDGLTYSIERAATSAGAGCNATSGTYVAAGDASIGSGSNVTSRIDEDVASGVYCYRAGAENPVTHATAFGYSERVTIANPPAPVGPPKSLDARITVNAGSATTIDAGDVVVVAFGKPMADPANAMMTAEDADGTVMDLRCLQSEQACTLNPAPETFGGVVYPANTVITMTIRTDLHLVTSGSTAGLQLPATVIYGGFTDLAGNGWDLQGSADVVLGSPD